MRNEDGHRTPVLEQSPGDLLGEGIPRGSSLLVAINALLLKRTKLEGIKAPVQ